MIPDLMRKAENLSRRSDKLCASVPQGKVDEIEREIACLKGEHREMSAKVFAYQEITSCMNVLTKNMTCLSQELMEGISTKIAYLHNSSSEIKRVVQTFETERPLRVQKKIVD